MTITKEYIQENLLDKVGNLKFTKLKKDFPDVTKEEIYRTYSGVLGVCSKNHKLNFVSFLSGYKECSICYDLKNFYSIENIKEFSKTSTFTSAHLKKIKEYHSLSIKDVYLLNNKIEYCPVCGNENIFNGQSGYAKTCSQKCGSLLERRNLTLEEKEIAANKRKETCTIKYGVSSNLVLLDKTGNNNPMKKLSVISKKNSTMIDRYGVISPLQNDELKKKAMDTFKSNHENKPFGIHPKREHFSNIDDFNVSYIENNFIDGTEFKTNEFENYFKCSSNVSLRVMRHFNLWDDNTSLPEQILNKMFPQFVKSKKIIAPYEIDMVYKNVCVEVNGDYWHSIESGTDKNYHLMKTNKCEEKGYKLFHFFETEIYNKREIIRSMIGNSIGLSSNIYARKCSIKEVKTEEAKIFLNENHIQGYSRSKYKIGLYYEGELVSIMTFGKPRFTNKYEYEIIRLASKLDTSVIGGASKMLKYFEKMYKPKSIISYANRRWSQGNVYDKLGFNKSHITSPGCWYYKNGEYFHRQQLQNHKLHRILENYDALISSKENIRKNGYYTIYDCGNLVYTKTYS